MDHKYIRCPHNQNEHIFKHSIESTSHEERIFELKPTFRIQLVQCESIKLILKK